MERVHRVRAPPALADLLKEARAHPASEREIQQLRHVAVGVGLGDPRRAEAEVHLLEALLVNRQTGPRLGRTAVHERRGARQRPEFPPGHLEEILVRQGAGRCNEDAIGPVPRLEEAKEVVTVEARDRFCAAGDRPRERVARPEGQVEELVYVVVRTVLDLRYLLDDHRALALDLLAREARLSEDVGEEVQCEGDVLAQHFCVVAGVLLAGECVQPATHGIDLLGDLGRGAPLRPLEEEMLEKVRDSRLIRMLVAGAVLHPDADRHRGEIREVLGQHPDAV